MLTFESDYTEGAHPRILERLMETNLDQQSGYGVDRYCESAREKIRAACAAPAADVFFLSGGTQTNRTVISSMLRPYEGVVAADTGHVAGHEAGAIEHSGHKVLTVPGHNGKVDVQEVRDFLQRLSQDGNRDHMVFPGMVYISYPTEYGTLYSKAELTALHALCREFAIPLFVDGARLGYGLMSRESDLTLPELADLCDVFYIGGTKVGALLGEAVVFPRGNAPKHFFTMVKQQGALLAKGRAMGVQFETLFTDDLYFRISRHAIDMAMELKRLFREKGYPLYLDSPTNQQFVVLTREQMDRLSAQVGFGFWEALPDGSVVVRFATSWATTPEQLGALAALL